MMKVYKECCKNCLLSPDRIVSPERAKEIISGCKREQTSFQCHKATMRGEDILCKNFYDQFGHFSQMVRISERLNMVQFVDQPDGDKLPTYVEMKANKQSA
jgi:hypothetical protein